MEGFVTCLYCRNEWVKPGEGTDLSSGEHVCIECCINGGPAFPGTGDHAERPGLSRLDFFAASALQGLIGRLSSHERAEDMVRGTTGERYAKIADEARKYASALVAAIANARDEEPSIL